MRLIIEGQYNNFKLPATRRPTVDLFDIRSKLIVITILRHNNLY